MTITREELERKVEEAFRHGFRAGRLVGTIEPADFPRPMSVVEAGRRHLRVVPADEPTAQLLDFPQSRETAS